jgi:hypothetical protein
MQPVWDRLIRFEAHDGRILNGEPIVAHPDFDVGSVTADDDLKARVIEGTDIFATDGSTKVTDQIVAVAKVLGPLTHLQVPILRCVGLNYAKHSTEIQYSEGAVHN